MAMAMWWLRAKKKQRTCQRYPAARASRSVMPSGMRRSGSLGVLSRPLMTRCCRCSSGWQSSIMSLCLCVLHGSHIHPDGCVSSASIASIPTDGRVLNTWVPAIFAGKPPRSDPPLTVGVHGPRSDVRRPQPDPPLTVGVHGPTLRPQTQIRPTTHSRLHGPTLRPQTIMSDLDHRRQL